MPSAINHPLNASCLWHWVSHMISDVFETGKPTTELPWGKSAARRKCMDHMDLDLR